jgi:hypothetical protein
METFHPTICKRMETMLGGGGGGSGKENWRYSRGSTVTFAYVSPYAPGADTLTLNMYRPSMR